MIIINYIFLYLLVLLQVLNTVIPSEKDYQGKNPAIDGLVIDTSYSAMTHENYMSRIKEAYSESDTTRIKELLGVTKWDSVDLYKNVRDDIQVFGWHPYWAEKAVGMYDYELLTMVSYFGYEFNASDGKVRNEFGWSSTKLHENARKAGSPVNIYLTVFSYDSTDTFLKNDVAMIQLVDDVDSLLAKKNAHGVTLDFQNISANYSDKYLMLLKRFSEILKPKNREILVVIPAADPESVYPVNEMAEYFDYLIVMGYDFHGRGEKKGPFSVLYDTNKWPGWSIEKRVTDLLADDPSFDPKQVLISLGWIGSLYEEIEGKQEHQGYRSIGFMNNELAAKDSSLLTFGGEDIEEDKVSRSNFIEYRNKDNSNLMTYYFTDTTSFALNLDWIQKKELGGVAIWTLADAGNIRGYWNAVAETYGKPPWWFVNNIYIPTRDFLKDEWLNPFLSLFLSIVITLSYLTILSIVIYRKNVPDWLQQAGVFLPLITTIIMVLCLSHDLIAHYGVDRDDDPWLTATSVGFGTLVLLISLWYCFRVYYLDRRRVP